MTSQYIINESIRSRTRDYFKSNGITPDYEGIRDRVQAEARPCPFCDDHRLVHPDNWQSHYNRYHAVVTANVPLLPAPRPRGNINTAQTPDVIHLTAEIEQGRGVALTDGERQYKVGGYVWSKAYERWVIVSEVGKKGTGKLWHLQKVAALTLGEKLTATNSTLKPSTPPQATQHSHVADATNKYISNICKNLHKSTDNILSCIEVNIEALIEALLTGDTETEVLALAAIKQDRWRYAKRDAFRQQHLSAWGKARFGSTEDATTDNDCDRPQPVQLTLFPETAA